MAHSQPENHVASCSDPIELLASPSQDGAEGAYQAAREGSDAFTAKSEAAASKVQRRGGATAGRAAMTETK